ncbi:MAG: RluA family pseudouridine synthase [Alphaproteobacteria bacterium]|nr:RluA family pseudouridine synthase [Alphaproteobacteria bacterium]
MEFESSRLDKYIRRVYGKLIPQALIEKALRNKDILVNGQRAKSSDKVSKEDDVFVHSNVCKQFANVYCCTENVAQQKDYSKYINEFKKLIVYEDEDLIIVNKPSGLAVQLGTKMNMAIDVMAKAYNREARLVHRIDKETSGLTILAKNIETSRYMLHVFQNKLIEKKYLALVSEELPFEKGTINKPLFRDKEKVVVDFEKGQKAITEFHLLKHIKKGMFLVELSPFTGRTHQIRVHLASIGCPIIGDKKYGGKDFKRLCLHASSIKFKKQSGKVIQAQAKIPELFS